MSLCGSSKREHCMKCESVAMLNYVMVKPGCDTEVFVECATCGAFVARYTLTTYTSEDPYRSYLRLMRKKRSDSGAATRQAGQKFVTEVWEGYRQAKDLVADSEEVDHLEEILDRTE
ncbi:hypothetical protein JXA88_00505 [Candidatus Fermentibacteria bacterium]|nr:hypothetical protein [Candidatus Fermentibacteria bacterium]